MSKEMGFLLIGICTFNFIIMKIIFDFEGRMENEAFFALYAGLRMYKEVKENQIRAAELAGTQEPGAISIPAAEAFGMLCDLEENFPRRYKYAKEEYEANY